MAYRLLYGGRSLHDPIGGEGVTDAQLTARANSADYLDFTVGYGHPLYGDIAENAETVELFWNKAKLFEGVIESIETDLEGGKAVSCKGGLSYLEDTVVRAYSTVEGEQPLVAPSSPSGLFAWYIEQHNAHCGGGPKAFRVGENQASMLDANAHIYRSSTQSPTTWDEVKSKLVEPLGGYVSVEYTDPPTVNYYADVREANAQVVDFGVNITDFSKTVDTQGQYTAIYAQGATPEAGGGGDARPIDLSGLPDGFTAYGADFYKDGDRVYSVSGVRRYGWREYAYSNDDCTTAEGLLESACKALANLASPSLSVTAKAVDLALYMDGYDHLRAGQAVRVRSKFHGIDEYLMVQGVSLDLNDPSQTEYELGASYQTLTGQQSSYLRALNSNIDSALDAASAMSAEAKAAAKDASDAADAAESAAKDAGRAVVSSTVEYAQGPSPTEAPTEGWSAEAPECRAGAYTWMRTTTATADGRTSTSAPALITGNDGNGVESATVEYASGDSGTDPPADGWQASPPEVAGGAWLWTRTTTEYADGTATRAYSAARQGADAAAVELATGAGSVLRNSRGSTSLIATVASGGERISDLASLRAAFGETARLAWREQAPGGEAKDIPEGDPRLGNDGFTLLVSADSVAGEKNFTCDLEI